MSSIWNLSPARLFLPGSSRVKVCFIKENFQGSMLHLCEDWGDPTLLPKDNGRRLSHVCVGAHPGEFPKQRETAPKVLIVRLPASLPLPFPPPPAFTH